MKTQNTIKFLATALFVGAVFTSCQSSSEENIVSQEVETFSDLEVQTETEINNITDDISSIVDQTFDDEEYANKVDNNNPQNRFLPECATVTRVVTSTTKDVTIDFGESCELRNGNIVSGKILMHYVLDKTALTKTVDVSFDNFFNDGKKIEGGHSVLKERENLNGNPQSTYTININITWEDGTTASRTGTKIRELIEGQDTPIWADNVFLVSGNWNSTLQDGTIYIATITTPLRKELSCRFMVSGVIAFQKDDLAAILDYGDGTCDGIGTLTIDGVTETIDLTSRPFL